MAFNARSLAQVASSASVHVRVYHAATTLRRPYKDSQNRESLKPKSAEGTMSGRVDDVAKNAAAFDPSKTSPETERREAARDAGDNPLDASGANQEISKPLGDKKTANKQATRNDGQRKRG
ncbi:hypothetical protein RJ55_01263 [Drechmeria coniospora]|nr:hypothetical protein RJ55_01263 [Drechmeria coniospora]